MALEDRELRSFVVLAETLHFGKAADLLHISQPALSKQIKGMEETIGGPLLLRDRRTVALTRAGELVYMEARRLVRDLDALYETAVAAVQGEAGTLRIAVGIATVHSVMPPALRRFRDRYPRVHIQVGDMSSPRQLQALLSGELDVGFLRLPIDHPQVAVRSVLKERLMIATSSRFRGPLRLKTISDMPFIVISRTVSSSHYDHCIRVFGRAGISPRVIQEANDMFTLLNLLRAGIGVALVPRSARQMRVAGLRFGPIPLREAEWEIGVAWNRQRESAMVKNFVQECLQARAQN